MATANTCNNYFTNVGSSISSNISNVNGSVYDYINTKCEKSMFLASFVESEIVSVVKESSPKKSTAYIGLNMEVIKHAMPNIATPQCHLRNKSLLDGRFPNIHGCSVVVVSRLHHSPS